jgi:hypothetical protein
MIVSHRGPTDKAVQACLDYRQAAKPKSEHWWTASLLLAEEYQRAARHQEALKVLDDMLALDKLPANALTAAESHIALGQLDRAKALIDDARQAVPGLRRSEQKMDRDVATFLERRVAELEKKMNGLRTKE